VENDVAEAINLARTSPATFAPILEKLLSLMEDDRVVRFPNGSSKKMREGRTAVMEAIDFVRQQPPVPPLRTSRALCLSARDHVANAGPVSTVCAVSLGECPGLCVSEVCVCAKVPPKWAQHTRVC
jgi:hypothetical protein